MNGHIAFRATKNQMALYRRLSVRLGKPLSDIIKEYLDERVDEMGFIEKWGNDGE